MKKNSMLIKIKTTALLLSGLLLTAVSSHAVDLAAVEGEWTPPDSATPIPMWGFIADPGACPGAPVNWNLGPRQNVASGGSLTINLRNCLSEPVSIVIPGQNTTLSPVIIDDGGRPRATSFTAQAPADSGASLTAYSWTNLKPGTFIYQSGSNPAKQVQMGLYGALVVGNIPASAAGEAMVFYSEIDPALHPDQSGAAATPLTYKPKYFLINGAAYSAGQAIPLVFNGKKNKKDILIRIANAGLMSHYPVIQGPYMRVIAEDGNPYPFARVQYSVHAAAGKTLEALWAPTKKGKYAIYDRGMSLSTNGAPGGGLLAYLDVDIFPWPMFIPAITGNKLTAGL